MEKKKINCANDAQMVAEGLRQPRLEINRDEFKKTEEEKNLLKKLKKEEKILLDV